MGIRSGFSFSFLPVMFRKCTYYVNISKSRLFPLSSSIYFNIRFLSLCFTAVIVVKIVIVVEFPVHALEVCSLLTRDGTPRVIAPISNSGSALPCAFITSKCQLD